MARSSAARTQAPTEDQSAEIARLTAALAEANEKLASPRDVPNLAPRGLIDSGEFKTGQGDGDVTMSSDGAAALSRPTIEPVHGFVHKDKLDNLAFNEELVVVVVHTSDSKDAEPAVSVWNSGRHQIFPRGCEVTCKRKFVEVLARAKPVSFRNVEYVDADGNKSVKWPKTTAQRYPFAVMRDDNPNGRAWLKKILAEA